MSSVLVFNAAGEPLSPCHPARARQLLRKGRAAIVSKRPYAIRLVDPGETDQSLEVSRSPSPLQVVGEHAPAQPPSATVANAGIADAR